MSSHVFLQLIASVTNVHINPCDFALASMAWLSLLRYAAVSISVNHFSNSVESCLLKTAISCSRELVRCVCFCVVHSVSVYWHTTSQNGSVSVGVEVGCVLSVRVSILPVLGSLCGPILPLVDLLWLLYVVISCVFLLWYFQVCLAVRQEVTEADICL